MLHRLQLSATLRQRAPRWRSSQRRSLAYILGIETRLVERAWWLQWLRRLSESAMVLSQSDSHPTFGAK